MPCNCGKKARTLNSKHVYIDASGKQTVFNTEIEARAAKIKAGGTGEVKPA